ncbi:MAG TPA: SCO1664 family protein [Anaerolineales bacterium]|nr:SCO1664 family protein [Anaerolineales bacterium]
MPSVPLPFIFENGAIELKGQFTRGNNYTFLVNVRHEDNEVLAVYKPLRGEQPLWDFPEASLAGREVCAWLVSQALGFDLVPFTLLRDGPLGPGSFQQYIDHNPNYHYFNFKPADLERLRPVALFDLLVNNADRKGSHILVEKRTRKLYLIDHGLCFHVENKLRTVIWDFAGQPIPGELMAVLASLQDKTDLPARLAPYLSPEEVAALGQRAEALQASGHFPFPPEDRRAYPFPPV